MSTPTPKTKCRFCIDAEPMSLTTLRKHVDKHPEEAPRIRDSLPTYPQSDGRDYGARTASVGYEFKKLMGYGPFGGAAPDVQDPEDLKKGRR